MPFTDSDTDAGADRRNTSGGSVASQDDISRVAAIVAEFPAHERYVASIAASHQRMAEKARQLTQQQREELNPLIDESMGILALLQQDVYDLRQAIQRGIKYAKDAGKINDDDLKNLGVEGLGFVPLVAYYIAGGVLATLLVSIAVLYTWYSLETPVRRAKAEAIIIEAHARADVFIKANGQKSPGDPFLPYPGGSNDTSVGSQVATAAGGITTLLLVGGALWFLLPLFKKGRK